MSRLFLIYDLSPSRPWLFTTVHANRALLNAHGIDLGPFHPWSWERVPSHLPYWNVRPEGAAVPAYLAGMMAELARRLASGQDALLLSWTPNLLAHQSMERLWQKYPAMAKHDVRILFILGRPVCVLEQRYRETLSLLPEHVGFLHAKRYGSLPDLIINARQKWGDNKVSLLANLSDNPVAQARDDLGGSLFDFLGCPPPLPLPHLPRHPLFLASNTARRLSWTPEVRGNAWPYLDEGLFMDSLCAVDRQWGTEPVCPQKVRNALIRDSADALRELEALLALKTGSLDCPDWLAAQPEAPIDAPLPDDRLRAFAASLPPEVREPLCRRFANDAPLLRPDQKALAGALSATGPADYTAIGEPVPPVALTVLTMTYNHKAYIAECMDSVLAQQTSFPVRHVVLDHLSTDGTADIVAAYAAKYPSIRPVLLSGRRPSENVMGLFLRCRTKYAALCDGDDYFTDPLKLQKQVDFLESRPHCALCFHPVRVVYENGEHPPAVHPPLSMLPGGAREEYSLADLLQGNMIQTNSIVYRWRFREGMPEWFRPDLCPGDWYWHLLHAEMGKIGFLQEAMSVYRRHKKAIYYTTAVSSLEHRRVHGMAELQTYKVINDHFRNRYFSSLAMLASGVLADFLKIYVDEEDQTLLNEASKTFPNFVRYFLSALDIGNEGKNCPQTPHGEEGL